MTFSDVLSALDNGPSAIVLRNVRLPSAMAPTGLDSVGDGIVTADIWIASGRIEAIDPPGRQGDARTEIQLDRAMVWALPVDCHTHVDKGQTWGRAPNPDGSFAGAMEAGSNAEPADYDVEDIRVRAGFILDCALAHGTAALRTHVDVDWDTCDAAMGVMREVAQDYRDRMPVQLAPFFGLGQKPEFAKRAAEHAAGSQSGVLSTFLYRDPGLRSFLRQIFSLADRFGLALDFHADETLDPDSHCLRAVAETAIATGFEGPVLVGHACALSVQSRTELDRTLDLVAQAEIGVVSLPLCNLYLQGRGARSPRQRGIAPLKEMAAKGIPVAIASDNVRDRFHAYGDMDLPEVFRQCLSMMHLDHPVGDWPASVSTAPARMMGMPDLGCLRVGGPADLMIFPARNWTEFGARPISRRILLRGGVVQDANPPDFAQLDHLKGMTV